MFGVDLIWCDANTCMSFDVYSSFCLSRKHKCVPNCCCCCYCCLCSWLSLFLSHQISFQIVWRQQCFSVFTRFSHWLLVLCAAAAAVGCCTVRNHAQAANNMVNRVSPLFSLDYFTCICVNTSTTCMLYAHRTYIYIPLRYNCALAHTLSLIDILSLVSCAMMEIYGWIARNH